MDKINYYLVSLEELKEVKGRPSMLLHACCGPCSTFPLTFLCPHFDVTIYYNNSNIFPEQEYSRRLEELKKFLEYFKRDYGYNVKLIIPKYDNKEYNQFLSQYEGEKEGGGGVLPVMKKEWQRLINSQKIMDISIFRQ